MKMARGTPLRLAAVTALVASAAASHPAYAVLERVGPENPAPTVGNYPAWYQDTTGVALEFCDPQNQSEVEGGWCLLLPGDVHIPEAFPANFFDEHFYFAADAALAPASGGRALLRVAVEAAFANGPAAPGDQITFSRIRVKLTGIPVTGTYRFIHPYGEELIDAEAGSPRGIFFTEDIGINCPPGGPFDCTLQSRLGPFLVPSAVPGGPELPAVSAANPTPDTDPAHFGGAFAPTPYPATGKSYLADPARVGPVTGSALPPFVDSTGALRDHNVFRIEGPPGSGLGVDPATGARVDWIETTDFALMGRVYTDTLPGRVQVTRASYAANGSVQKLDVFATGAETTQGRVPAQARPAPVKPVLSFFDAPCTSALDARGFPVPPFGPPAGAREAPLVATGSRYWAQTQPAVIPAQVCVKDAAARDVAGNVIPVYIPRAVADEVAVTSAVFDPTSGTLTVSATSSDALTAPTLTLGGFGDLRGGTLSVPSLLAPPDSVRVLSSQGGSADLLVTTRTGRPAALPVAVNDSVTVDEDSGATVVKVLDNDDNAAGGVVTLTSAPRLGTATVDAEDGTVTYTPGANVFGADAFTYTVTVGETVSNVASVSITIRPLNDPPLAVNDLATTSANVPIAIDVLANDLDPDGAADLASVVNLTQPVPAGATATASGRLVTFTASTPGTYTFSYRAQDRAGATSPNAATVTVTVAAAEQVQITRAQFTRSQARLRVDGTISPDANQSIRVDVVNAAGAVLATAGSTTELAGAWTVDVKGFSLPNGATAVKATSSNGTVATLALTLK